MRSKSQKKKVEWTRGERAVRWVTIGFVFVLAFFALWFSWSDEFGRNELKAGEDLTVPLADLKPGKLFLSGYAMDSSTRTQLAVQRGDDGVIRVAFAACRACSKAGHYKWQGKVLCRRCGRIVRLPDPGSTPDEKRRCTSVAIPYSVEDGRLLVRAQEIEGAYQQWYLPRPGKL